MLAGRAGPLGLETRVCGGRARPAVTHAADPEDLRSGAGRLHLSVGVFALCGLIAVKFNKVVRSMAQSSDVQSSRIAF